MAQNTTFSQVISIIQFAMKNAMMLEEGQEPNSEQIADGIVRLNMLANHLQTKGLRLWTQVDYPITLVAGQSLYPLTGTYGKPLRIPRDLGYMLYTASGTSNTTKTPIITLSQQEWVLLNQSGTQGMVTQIYVDKQLSALNVNTYLIPDTYTAASYVLHVVYQQMMTPAQQITDTTMFPLEWYQGLSWLLSQQMCQGQPAAVVGRIDAMAEKYEADLDGWDVEDAQTWFQPDTRNMYWGSRFK
jgi:hypothetical protein